MLLIHHQASKPAMSRRRKEHVPTGSCQVWSWDITYLQTCIKVLFFYLYMVVDVWSHKIIAAQVFAEESMDHSSTLLAHACMIHGVQPEELVLHSDNGGPMKGATMLATLHKLGVIPSFSRLFIQALGPIKRRELSMRSQIMNFGWSFRSFKAFLSPMRQKMGNDSNSTIFYLTICLYKNTI